MNKFTYVIGWNNFNINSGGQIVLYFLCHLLNSLGYKAYMSGGLTTNALNLNCPVMPKTLDLQSNNVIVVYPEVISGNPLKAKNVVRWILYTIGVHGGSVQTHKPEDLILGFRKEFSGNGCLITEENQVGIYYVIDHYKNFFNQTRDKTCYLVHKGGKYHRTFDQHPINSIKIDGKSHKNIADIFNQCHTFYSYDPNSGYSKYAALCGCDSIVIPRPNLDIKDWRKDARDRLGIAYGLEDLPRARETRSSLVKAMRDQDEINLQNVQKFIRLCNTHFK
jgi:hypothetical protein